MTPDERVEGLKAALEGLKEICASQMLELARRRRIIFWQGMTIAVLIGWNAWKASQ